MKKKKTKMYAFSLAEALITLLIVCLITLASIPVLTKKRRTITDGGSGQWICTLVEQKDANGNVTGYKHVYWNSQTSDGDINDPSTWDVAGDGTSCTFVPPMKAKNFAVTYIGGGGGGADGASRQEEYLNANKTITQELPAGDEYYVAVIGGGGGGSVGNSCGDCSGEPAGSGNAGAYVLAKMNLSESVQFNSIIGKGGHSLDGYDTSVGDDYVEGKGYAWAGSASKLLNAKTGQELIVAPGGGSGQHRHAAGWKCKGGCERGNSRYTNAPYTSNGFETSNVYNAQILDSGVKAFCGNRQSIHTDGYIIPKSYYNSNYGPFGSGGKSAYGGQAHIQESGTDGIVLLWRILQMPGLGGDSSPLESTTLATIKGKLVAHVGAGGNPGSPAEPGEKTTINIYDPQGKLTRTFISKSGAAGELSNESIGQKGHQSIKDKKKKVDNTTYVEGGAGANSQWLAKGGGTPGKCKGAWDETIPKTCTRQVDKTKVVGHYYYPGCVRVAEVFKPGEIPSLVNGTRCSQLVSIVSGSSSSQQAYPCIGHKMGTILDVDDKITSDGNRLEGINTMDPNWKDYVKLTDLLKGNYSSQEKFNAELSKFNLKNTGWSHSDSVAYSAVAGDCYNWADISNKDELRDIIYKYKEDENYDCSYSVRHEPSCSPAGNGTYFGAGGGGGGATNTISLAGKGGKGAPGAVIVEW